MLIDTATGERTTVIHDQLTCQCDRFPFGSWSSSGQHFVGSGGDRTVLVDAEDGSVQVMSGATGTIWSPNAEEPRTEQRQSRPAQPRDGRARRAGRLQCLRESPDGRFIVVSSFGSRGAALLARRGLEPVAEFAGRIEQLAADGDRVTLTIRDAEGCDNGIVVVVVGEDPRSFVGARFAALAPDGSAVALTYVDLVVHSSRERSATHRIETFDLGTGERATVLEREVGEGE